MTNRLRSYFVAIFLGVAAMHCFAQTLPAPANASFVPKVAYSASSDKVWSAVIAAMNANSIQVAAAIKDAGQISSEYMAGPTEQGSFFTGSLVTRYKFSVTIIPLGKGQTQISVKPTLQARRLAASAGKIMSGNNAVSDVEWIDATGDNPNDIEGMRKWFFEKVEASLR